MATPSTANTGRLEPGTFDPLLHQKFSVYPPLEPFTVRNCSPEQTEPAWADTPVELELVEVTRYPDLAEKEGGFEHRPREPFALLFLGSHEREALLGSSMHLVRHPEVGDLRLLLNPVQMSMHAPPENHPQGRFYECVLG